MKSRFSAWGRVVSTDFPAVCSVSITSCNELYTSLWGRRAAGSTPGYSLYCPAVGLGCREGKAGNARRPLLPLQLLLGRTDASLRVRKLWRFLPELCRHMLLHKPCVNLLFLLSGYNEKNLNVVGVPFQWGRGSQGHSSATQPATATRPQCSKQADPAWATCVPLPPDAFPPGTGKAPRLCWVNVSGQVALDSTPELGQPVTVTTPALTHLLSSLWVTSGSH